MKMSDLRGIVENRPRSSNLLGEKTYRVPVTVFAEDEIGWEYSWSGEFCGVGLRYFHIGYSYYSDGWYVSYEDEEYGLGLVLIDLDKYFVGLEDEELTSEEESYNKIHTEEELDKWLEERPILLEYYCYNITGLL